MAGEGEAVGYITTHAIAYSRLPYSPFSLKWKELTNPVIRRILREMFSCVGYRRGEKKLGEGVPPMDWPADIDWYLFKGST